MDKRRQVSFLVDQAKAMLQSVDRNYTAMDDSERTLAALDTTIDKLMQIWQIIKTDEETRLNTMFGILADEQSFKKDE